MMNPAVRYSGICPGHGQIVHRAADRKVTDIATGKEQRRNDIGIGRIGEPLRTDINDRGVTCPGVPEGRAEMFLDQGVHQFSAAAVSQGGILSRIEIRCIVVFLTGVRIYNRPNSCLRC